MFGVGSHGDGTGTDLNGDGGQTGKQSTHQALNYDFDGGGRFGIFTPAAGGGTVDLGEGTSITVVGAESIDMDNFGSPCSPCSTPTASARPWSLVEGNEITVVATEPISDQGEITHRYEVL